MRRLTLALGVAAAVIFAANVYARATDFSGKWTLDQAKTTAANPAMTANANGRGTRGGNMMAMGTMTVAQDATKLTVTRGQGSPAVYNLDGSNSTITMNGRNGQTTQTANATWDGANLKIVTKGTNGDTTAVWSLDNSDLKIVTTSPGRNGGPARTNTQIYTKSS